MENMMSFPVMEHSEHRCFLFFRGALNVPVRWKDFTVETTLKMADSPIPDPAPFWVKVYI